MLIAVRFFETIRQQESSTTTVDKNDTVGEIIAINSSLETSSTKDKRTPLMLKIQQEAEEEELPADNQSDKKWTTASDLARQIGRKRTNKPRGSRRKEPSDKKPKTPHQTAMETLSKERTSSRCIWPSDQDAKKLNPNCGWAKHARFWRKREGESHPVFYYRQTTEDGWQEKQQ